MIETDFQSLLLKIAKVLEKQRKNIFCQSGRFNFKQVEVVSGMRINETFGRH